MEEEANSICIIEGRMVGARNSLYIKVPTETYETHYEMPCIMAFQVHVVVENAETLHVGWSLYIRSRECVCECVCVCE